MKNFYCPHRNIRHVSSSFIIKNLLLHHFRVPKLTSKRSHLMTQRHVFAIGRQTTFHGGTSERHLPPGTIAGVVRGSAGFLSEALRSLRQSLVQFNPDNYLRQAAGSMRSPIHKREPATTQQSAPDVWRHQKLGSALMPAASSCRNRNSTKRNRTRRRRSAQISADGQHGNRSSGSRRSSRDSCGNGHYRYER